jgi:pseudolysin/vibriolysin
MRLTTKLSLATLAILLANCSLPSDEGVSTNEGAASTSKPESFDSRAGLLSLHVTTKSPRVTRGDAASTAMNYLANAVEQAGVATPVFSVIDVTDADPQDGLTHVRVQQTINGMKVWGADAVVHMSDDNVLGAAGAVARNLQASTAMTLTAAGALAKAKADRYGQRGVVTSREETETVVQVDDAGNPHVAIHTKFFTEAQSDATGDIEPAFWNHVYDANTGDVLARWNDLQTLEQASGPGGNPRYVHSWNQELDVEPTTTPAGSYVMNTARLHTLNMNQGTTTGAEVTGPLDNIGDAPINDAHGFAEVTLNFLNDWMNRNSIDDHGFAIKSRVHYSHNYENAYWDGTQMTYGDGATTFYPLSGGIDVCAHEIDHGFTSKHSNLTYSGQSGGLNEGFSDIAGKTAEFYYKPNADFDLGADVFKTPGKALRYMCDPHKDGKSIDNVSQFTSTIDVHYSSGVPNKSFCLASKRLSSGDPNGTATKDGVKRAAQAYFLANASYWTSGTTFMQACQGVLDAARALSFTADEITALKQSWADVGATTCN